MSQVAGAEPLRLEPENAVEAAILGRRSIRGFTRQPVDRATIARLLDVSARAPSGTNMQPWRMIALAGAPLAAFCATLERCFLAGDEAKGIERPYYPAPLHEPYLGRRRKIGWDLYNILGIGRGDREKASAQVVRNLHFFGAPVGLICLLDRRLEIGSWLDYGMFLQNISTAARGVGLDSCPMAIFAEFPRTIRATLGVDETDVIVCGMAIGYEDTTELANSLRTERIGADAFCEFRGFDGPR